MIEILYIHSAHNNYKTKFFERLDSTVNSLPEDLFYREDIMPEDLNKEFNVVIVAELKREFKDSLKVTNSYKIKHLYPYPVDVLVAQFSLNIRTGYNCIFVPYRESALVWECDGVPPKYMALKIIERLGLMPISMWDMTATYTIGYVDPRESIGIVG